MAEVLVGTVTDNNGLVINVYATESGGGITFRIDVAQGYADLRGFFFDYTGTAITVADTGDNALVLLDLRLPAHGHQRSGCTGPRRRRPPRTCRRPVPRT